MNSERDLTFVSVNNEDSDVLELNINLFGILIKVNGTLNPLNFPRIVGQGVEFLLECLFRQRRKFVLCDFNEIPSIGAGNKESVKCWWMRNSEYYIAKVVLRGDLKSIRIIGNEENLSLGFCSQFG